MRTAACGEQCALMSAAISSDIARDRRSRRSTRVLFVTRVREKRCGSNPCGGWGAGLLPPRHPLKLNLISRDADVDSSSTKRRQISPNLTAKPPMRASSSALAYFLQVRAGPKQANALQPTSIRQGRGEFPRPRKTISRLRRTPLSMTRPRVKLPRSLRRDRMAPSTASSPTERADGRKAETGGGDAATS